jgi:hypothetical protein
VPTLLIDEMLFWGADAWTCARLSARDPVFGADEMRRAGSLPEGKAAPAARGSLPDRLRPAPREAG